MVGLALGLARAARPGPHPLLETLLRRLREGGFGPALLDVAFHTLNNHTVGHALQAIGFGTDRDQLVAGANAFLDHLDQDTHPELTAHVLWHLDQPPGPSGDAFGLALDLLLEGLERLRSAGDLWRPRSLRHTDGAAGEVRGVSAATFPAPGASEEQKGSSLGRGALHGGCGHLGGGTARYRRP